MKYNLLLLLATCCGAASLATAQTGRIAHLSHGGSVRALVKYEEVDDNLGIPPMKRVEWKRDTLAYVNDSTVIHAGQMRTGYSFATEKEGWHRVREKFLYSHEYKLATERSMISYLKAYYPSATFMGFGKSRKAHRLKKNQKPSSHSQPLSRRPFQYGYWRELSSLVAIGAVSWLLGKKPTA